MCAGISATVVWIVAWLAATSVAIRRAAHSPDGWAWLGAGVGLLMVALHSWVLVRLLRSVRFRWTGPVARSEQRLFRERWPSRMLGYLAVVLFVGVAVAWNLGFIGRLVQIADEGEGWWMLVMIPWSLLGWLLLVMLFAGIGAMVGSLLTVLRRFGS
jgi:hypothetical protein